MHKAKLVLLEMKVTPNRQKRCENPATTYPFTPSESKSKRNKPEILDQKKKTKTRHCHHSWYLPEIMLWILKGPQYPPILWPQEWTKKHTTNINQWWSMMFNQCWTVQIQHKIQKCLAHLVECRGGPGSASPSSHDTRGALGPTVAAALTEAVVSPPDSVANHRHDIFHMFSSQKWATMMANATAKWNDI